MLSGVIGPIPAALIPSPTVDPARLLGRADEYGSCLTFRMEGYCDLEGGWPCIAEVSGELLFRVLKIPCELFTAAG